MRQTRRQRSIRNCLGVWLGSLVALAGCSGFAAGDDGGGVDGAPPDARVVDGPMLVDASRDGGGVADTGPGDGAPGDGGADAGGSCFGMCDPMAGSGCGDGSVCLLTDGEPRCEASAGVLEAGERCESTADCAAGLACFQSRDAAVCRAVCCPGAPGACGDEGRCSEGDLVDGSSPDWGMCLPPRACDVLRPEETCEPGEGCYIVSEMGDTDCRPAGDADVGEHCSRQSDCAPGMFCNAADACVRICATPDGEPPSCPAGEGECMMYSYSPTGTGLCTVVDTMTAW